MSAVHLLTDSQTVLFDATATATQGQSEPGINGYEGVLHILQSCGTEVSPSDAVECHHHDIHGGRGAYPSAEMQLPYSTALANWAYITITI